MATQIFFTNSGSVSLCGVNGGAKLIGGAAVWSTTAMSTSRGSGVGSSFATPTVTGPTAGIEIQAAASTGQEWMTAPLDADITISGTITVNLWALESHMNANVAINVVIEKIAGNTGAVSTILTTAQVVELGTSSAVQNFTGTPTSTACLKGDRIRIRVFGDDATGVNMASGFTFTFKYNGTTAAADGDSYVSFTETFGFLTTAPAGSTTYMTGSEADSYVLHIIDFASGGTYESVANGAAPAWSNPSNASASDDTYATVVLTGTGSQYLVCRNLGLSIPTGHAPVYISVEVECKIDAGTVTFLVQPQNDVGTLIGFTKNVAITTTETAVVIERTLPGAGDPFSVGNYTKAMVEDPDFGVRLFYNGATTGTVSVDRIRVKVFYAPSGIEPREAWTARGTGSESDTSPNTVAGWTVPLTITGFGGNNPSPVCWYTKPLQTFTLGGLVQANFWARQTSLLANCAIAVELAVTDIDGTNATVWAVGTAFISSGSRELTTSLAGYNFDVSGKDLVLTNGQRIRIRAMYDDAGQDGPMVSGHQIEINYAGTAGQPTADSWVKFGQTLTEYIPVFVPHSSPYPQILPQ